MICATFWGEIRGLRPRPGLTWDNPSAPSWQNRRRQAITVGRPTPTVRAIAEFDSPFAANKITRARRAKLCGVPWALTQRSKVTRSSADNSSAAAATPTRYTTTIFAVKLFLRHSASS